MQAPVILVAPEVAKKMILIIKLSARRFFLHRLTVKECLLVESTAPIPKVSLNLVPKYLRFQISLGVHWFMVWL